MYTDFVTRIKNAQEADHPFLKTPYTKMDRAIADILEKQDFLRKVEVKGRSSKKVIKIHLNPEKPIRGLQFISKPSRRIYKKSEEIRPVKSGFGTLVLSTSKGVITGSKAQKEKVGGQLLFKIW